ncbi:MAG: hypothetical protein M3544_13840 [Pseudomonadota bacterium]|nr:hypothetical protein [Pseudomonadota bacterium]
MTIKFANRDFDGPFPAGSWVAPWYGGVYAVLVRDASWAPLPCRPIYFGQTGNFAQRGFLRGHAAYHSWLAAAGGESNLGIATHWMPASTEAARQAIERALLRQYRPECNAVVLSNVFVFPRHQQQSEAR